MARTKSSRAWLQRHVSDPYVRKATREGYRSRSAYKLLEIDARDGLLGPGARVVDLGAAPGGWSQVAAQKVGPGGRLVAIDLLEIAPIPGVTVLKGDLRERKAELIESLGAKADLVLSDMLPNVTGIAAVDQARSAELALAAIEFGRAALKSDGALLLKVFHGGEFAEVLAAMREAFRTVQTRKPAASRGESRETYLLGRGLRPAGAPLKPAGAALNPAGAPSSR